MPDSTLEQIFGQRGEEAGARRSGDRWRPAAAGTARLRAGGPHGRGGSWRARRAGLDGRHHRVRRRRGEPARATRVGDRAGIASGKRGIGLGVVRKLVRRPALARRYLAVEGHRALAANDDLLPLGVRSMIDLDLAARTDSPAGSLRLAAGRGDIADPPPSFGVIRPQEPTVCACRGRTRGIEGCPCSPTRVEQGAGGTR